METTAQPAVLWLIHVELDARDIPPCLRWPTTRDPSPQVEFVTFAADFLWLCKRDSALSAKYRGWRTLVTSSVGSSAWHAVLHKQFLYATCRTSVAHWCAIGLGLTPAQRQDLMALPTRDMNADRRQLQAEKFEQVTERLLSNSMTNPDKAGLVSPPDVAHRRAAMWRVYILSGRNKVSTAKRWTLITGAKLSRQALTKQLDIVTEVLRERG